jgi:VWFA-related protein
LVLFANGQVVAISELRPVSDEPLSYALLLDLSGSNDSKKKLFTEAVRQTFDALNKIQARGVLVVFADKVSVVQGYVTRDSLSRGLDTAVYKGGTALNEAIDQTSRLLFEAKQGSGPGRRVIVVITDGQDNRSHLTSREAIQTACRFGVSVFGIGLDSPHRDVNRGKRALQEFADGTGGALLYLEKPRDFGDEFLDNLRHQYLLTFALPKTDRGGRFRSIEVKAPSRKDLRITAPEGYYDSSDPSIPLETKH